VRASASRLAPVVMTSSIRATWVPAGTGAQANALRTLRRLAASGSLLCAGVSQGRILPVE
jgi:hypothetical protein